MTPTRKRPGHRTVSTRVPPAGQRAPTHIDDSLRPAQLLFARAYLANGFHAGRAYRTAHPGVTANTARAEGHRTLITPNVRKWLNDRLEDAWKPLQMGGEQALARVALIASADIRDLYDEKGNLLEPHLWPDGIAACVKSIKDGPYGKTVTVESQLGALRTILEQTAKLETPSDSFDALAEAIRGDRRRHGFDVEPR